MTRACRACGREFAPQGSWQRLCWECWRERRDRESAEAAYWRGYRDGMNARGPAGRSGIPDAALLRDLIQLCHPDRHPPERFELANRATAQLNGMGRR